MRVPRSAPREWDGVRVVRVCVDRSPLMRFRNKVTKASCMVVTDRPKTNSSDLGRFRIIFKIRIRMLCPLGFFQIDDLILSAGLDVHRRFTFLLSLLCTSYPYMAGDVKHQKILGSFFNVFCCKFLCLVWSRPSHRQQMHNITECDVFV